MDKLLKLIHPAGLDIPRGAIAKRLPWGYMPEKLEALVAAHYGSSVDIKEFCCVVWMSGVYEDGYYLEARFESIKEVSKC